MLFYDVGDVFEVNVLVDVTVHQSTAIIVLDEALILLLWNSQVLGKSLFLKILDGMVIGIGQEVVDLIVLGEMLQNVHQPCAVSFNLLGMGDGKEGYFRKSLLPKSAVYYSSNELLASVLKPFENDDGLVNPIHDESDNVLLGHLWELLRNDALEIN